MFNWNQDCSYNSQVKRSFHATGRSRLRKLAQLLDFEKSTFDIRSNAGGIAVSGEVTLHHENVYVQVSQSCMGPNNSILIRTCKGRKDYHGGPNNFAPLDLLNDLPALAARVRGIMVHARPRLEREAQIKALKEAEDPGMKPSELFAKLESLERD